MAYFWNSAQDRALLNVVVLLIEDERCEFKTESYDVTWRRSERSVQERTYPHLRHVCGNIVICRPQDPFMPVQEHKVIIDSRHIVPNAVHRRRIARAFARREQHDALKALQNMRSN